MRIPRGRGVLRPAVFALVLCCFTLPFLTVSCDVPGGYGRVARGGTTTYSGYALAFGSAPRRSADQLLPQSQWRPDELSVQPLLLLALVVVVAGFVLPFLLRRREVAVVSGALALLAWLTVAGGAAFARGAIAERLAAQAAARGTPLSTPRAYVVNGQGLVLTLLLLGITVVSEVVLLWRVRARMLHGDPAEDGETTDPIPLPRDLGTPWSEGPSPPQDPTTPRELD